MIESQMLNLEPYIRTVTAILAHSVWQGLLIGLLAAIALTLLRNGNASVRYVVACGAMATVVIAAAVTAVEIWPDQTRPDRQTSGMTDQAISKTSSPVVGGPAGAPPGHEDRPPTHSWWRDPTLNECVFLLWVAGVLLLSAYHYTGWRRARGFVQRGISAVPPEWQVRFQKLRDDLKVTRMVSLLSSSVVKVPCVVSWMKPAILVPVGMFTSLTPAEIEMILVHELAHVRRYDVLFNILQTVVETLFFFSPAVWWLSHQIRIEREHCCDDTVVLRKDDRFTYARALANLAELKMLQTGFSSALNGTPLERRIRRIVGRSRPRIYSSVLSIAGMLLSASLVVVVLGALVTSGDSTVQASEKSEATQRFEQQPGDLHGEWETETDGSRLKILVYGRESSGMSYVLTPDELTAFEGQGKGPIQIVRDAGTLFLEGKLTGHDRKVEGRGDWYFRPDPAYMRFMGRYGLREDDRQKTFSLAIRNISREYLAEMEQLGYHDLTVDQLVSAGVFGITPELVKAYRELGYHDLTYQLLLSMQVQGVTLNDARRFEGLGLGHLTPEQLISAKIEELTPAYVESFRNAGFNDLTFANFGTLHAFKLDVDDFKDCYRNRFMDLTEKNMIWVCGFGITEKDIERMKDQGYTDIDSIINLLAIEYGR